MQSNDNLSALSLLDSEVFMFQMDKQRKSYNCSDPQTELGALKPSLAHHMIKMFGSVLPQEKALQEPATCSSQFTLNYKCVCKILCAQLYAYPYKMSNLEMSITL